MKIATLVQLVLLIFLTRQASAYAAPDIVLPSNQGPNLFFVYVAAIAFLIIFAFFLGFSIYKNSHENGITNVHRNRTMIIKSVGVFGMLAFAGFLSTLAFKDMQRTCYPLSPRFCSWAPSCNISLSYCPPIELSKSDINFCGRCVPK